jgi:hypothetical protein
VEVEEATISLARAVFAASGQLVCGAHPTIAPLLALVAGEFITPRDSEDQGERERSAGPSLVIHQVEGFRDELPEATKHLARVGLAQFVWHPVLHGDRRGGPSEIPYPESLRAMRDAMITGASPLALVCLGGMDGMLQEAEIFAERFPGRDIVAFRRTGGAAALLAESSRHRVLDAEDLTARPSDVGDYAPPPYSYLMQRLVRRISG